MFVFLVPILSPKKPYNFTLTISTTLPLAYSEVKVDYWGNIIGELVHMLAANITRGQPSYIGPFLFHLYEHENCSQMKNKPNGPGIRLCGSSRPPT